MNLFVTLCFKCIFCSAPVTHHLPHLLFSTYTYYKMGGPKNIHQTACPPTLYLYTKLNGRLFSWKVRWVSFEVYIPLFILFNVVLNFLCFFHLQDIIISSNNSWKFVYFRNVSRIANIWYTVIWFQFFIGNTYYFKIYLSNISICPWCKGYRHRKWTRRHEFKSWTRLIAFHIDLIPLGTV